MDKVELESRIIGILSGSDIEWMSAKQILEELSKVYMDPPTYKSVRQRLDSFVTHGMMDYEMVEAGGYRTKIYRIREAVA